MVSKLEMRNILISISGTKKCIHQTFCFIDSKNILQWKGNGRCGPICKEKEKTICKTSHHLLLYNSMELLKFILLLRAVPHLLFALNASRGYSGKRKTLIPLQEREGPSYPLLVL